MAFTVPDFNLTCGIYTGGTFAGKIFRANSPCNLAWGRRVSQLPVDISSVDSSASVAMTLLLPAGTDIRDSSTGGPVDIVEVPAGSGRWYFAEAVDDIGKGFANEHRGALLAKAWELFDPHGGFAGVFWPTPIP